MKIIDNRALAPKKPKYRRRMKLQEEIEKKEETLYKCKCSMSEQSRNKLTYIMMTGRYRSESDVLEYALSLLYDKIRTAEDMLENWINE